MNEETQKENIPPDDSDTTLIQLKNWIGIFLETGTYTVPIAISGEDLQIDAYKTQKGEIVLRYDGKVGMLISDTGKI